VLSPLFDASTQRKVPDPTLSWIQSVPGSAKCTVLDQLCLVLSCTVKSGFEPEGAARALHHGAFRRSRIVPRDGLELALDPTYQLITLPLLLFL
jgi:hypothetical protein